MPNLKRLWLCVSPVLGFAVVAILVGGDAPQPPVKAPFHGGSLGVTFREGDHNSVRVIRAAELQTIGGRTFLVGKIKDFNDEEPSYEGLTVWLPIDAVTEMIEFEDEKKLEQLPKKTSDEVEDAPPPDVPSPAPKPPAPAP